MHSKFSRVVKVAAVAAAMAGFAAEAFAGWTYDGSKVLTDGNWVLEATVKNGQLTLSKFVSATDETTLDLNVTVVNASDPSVTYTIVATGNNTFENRTGLVSVCLPDTLLNIGKAPFRGCTALTTVTPLLPPNLTGIGAKAFSGCSSLTGDVVFPESLVSVDTSWDGGANGMFRSSQITSCDMSKSSVTIVSSDFCSGCRQLKWVKLPPAVVTIDGTAFSDCTALESVSPLFPDTLKAFGPAAFYNCTSLTGDVVLANAEALSMGRHSNNGFGTFQNTKITSIDISAPMTTTPQNMCAGCTKLEWAKLPDTLVDFGYGSDFSGCTSLTNVTPFMAENVKSIGVRTFQNCSKLALPVVIAGTNSFAMTSGWPGHYGFSGAAIPSVTITAPVTQIGTTSYGEVFSSNKSLKEVELPPTLTVLGVSAFSGDSGLERVKFNGSAPTIDNNAFNGAGKARMYVPRFENYWEIFAAEKVVSMTDAEVTAYQAAYPEGRLPLGKYKEGSNNVYYFDKDDDELANTAYVVGRPWRVNADRIEYGTETGFAEAKTIVIPEIGAYEGVNYALDFWQIDVETADGVWEKVSDGTALEVVLAPDAQGRNVRLTVNWKVAAFAIDLEVSGGEKNGSVELDPAKDLYEINEEVTLTAVPAAGRTFLCWLGDVPDELSRDSSIKLTMTAARTIKAVFSADQWDYDKAAHTMTDGNWTIDGLANYNTAADNENHTLVLQKWNYSGTLVTEVGAPQELDLRKPIVDGDGVNWSIRVIVGSAFSGFTGYQQFERVLLPDTLEEIGATCFSGCTALAEVSPMFPKAVRFFGQAAFYNCTSLTGDVVLANAEALSMQHHNNNGYGTFQNTKITSIDISAPMTTAPGNMCGGCTKLEWAKLPDTLVDFGYGNDFSGCTSLTNVTPFMVENVKSIGVRTFQNCSKLAQPVVIAGTNSFAMTSAWPGHYGFSGAAIPSVTITAPVTQVGTTSYGEVFSSNKSLKEVELPPSLTVLGVNVFNGDSGLETVRFHGDCPATIVDNAFNGVTDYKVRIFYPRGNMTWNALPVGTVTPWKELTDTQTNKYWTAYPGGRRPTALWSIAGNVKRNLWLMPWNPKPTGMKILFR